MKRLVVPLAMLLGCSAFGAQWTVYVGTYTGTESKGGTDSKGIYALRFDDLTGMLTSAGLAAETSNPSFLALSPNRRFLYAANENSLGSVSAFAIDPQGKLKLLNTVSSLGSGPCHVAIDKTGKWLFVANYNSGSVAAYRVNDDGKLGNPAAFYQHSGSSVDPQRQTGPHAHSVNLSPDNRFVLTTDLGLDQILRHRFDPAKGMVPADSGFTEVARGAGPRHLAFSPNSRFAYAINEMLGAVTAFQYTSANGSLKEIQTISTLPAGFSGANSSAEIAVHPGGGFLYASNRGPDNIAVFRIDPASGMLTSAGFTPTGGKTPRNFAIDPTGKFLLAANQDSGNIVVFRVDPKTGALSPAGIEAKVPSPVSIVFAPTR